MDWVLFLGVATGMRCMTPMAVLCWFMYFAALPVSRLNLDGERGFGSDLYGAGAG